MKRLYILFLLSIGLTSCSKILDIEQNTKITTSTAWRTEASAKSNVAGIYLLMRSAFREGFVYWGEYRNGLWGGGRRNGANQEMSAIISNRINSTISLANWNGIYTTINQANLAIKYIPGVAFSSETAKNEALANAYFARAFCYFWIARIWGDAPLELQPYESMNSNEYSSRSLATQIFDQVEQDIEKAREILPQEIKSKSMVSNAGLEMLATDYYLWKYKMLQGSSSDLQKAKAANENVLSNPSYRLEPVYLDIFEKENGEQEVIFKWPYTQSEFVGGYASDFLYATTNVSNVELRDKIIPVSPDPQWTNITSAYAEYIYEDETDQRAKTSYGMYETYGWVNKFPGHLIASERVYDSDINVYRFADAVLFKAEINLALNELDEALTALNMIAKRAYGKDDYYTGITDPLHIKQIILDERKKEFVAEGRTWWDYIRLGFAFQQIPSLVGRSNEINVLYWPIHNASLNSNPNIKQTLGY